MDPNAAAEAAFEALVTHLDHERQVVDWLWMPAIAIMVWDYILTLRHEIKYVWLAPFNYTSILFIFVRYAPLCTIYFIIHFQFIINAGIEECKRDPAFIQSFMLIGVLFAEVIVMIRTWAIWNKDLRVGILLGTLQTAALVLSIIGNVHSIKSFVMAPPPFPTYRGCFVTGVKNTLPMTFITVTVYQSAVLLLLSLSLYRTMKSRDKTKLSLMIHRDGILFYLYILAITIGNVVMLEILPLDIGLSGIPLWSALYSVLICRVVLRIRHLAYHNAIGATQIHDFREGQTTLIPMQILAGVEVHEETFVWAL